MGQVHHVEGANMLSGHCWSNGNAYPVGWSAEFIDADGKLRTATCHSKADATAWIRKHIGRPT